VQNLDVRNQSMSFPLMSARRWMAHTHARGHIRDGVARFNSTCLALSFSLPFCSFSGGPSSSRLPDAANNSKRHRTKIGPAELCNTRLRNFIVCWPHTAVSPGLNETAMPSPRVRVCASTSGDFKAPPDRVLPRSRQRQRQRQRDDVAAARALNISREMLDLW